MTINKQANTHTKIYISFNQSFIFLCEIVYEKADQNGYGSSLMLKNSDSRMTVAFQKYY